MPRLSMRRIRGSRGENGHWDGRFNRVLYGSEFMVIDYVIYKNYGSYF
jgi:hypothetical protein